MRLTKPSQVLTALRLELVLPRARVTRDARTLPLLRVLAEKAPVEGVCRLLVALPVRSAKKHTVVSASVIP